MRLSVLALGVVSAPTSPQPMVHAGDGAKQRQKSGQTQLCREESIGPSETGTISISSAVMLCISLLMWKKKPRLIVPCRSAWLLCAALQRTRLGWSRTTGFTQSIGFNSERKLTPSPKCFLDCQIPQVQMWALACWGGMWNFNGGDVKEEVVTMFRSVACCQANPASRFVVWANPEVRRAKPEAEERHSVQLAAACRTTR